MVKPQLSLHPNLYEINTRVWISNFGKADDGFVLSDVPDKYWDYLADKGMDMVWLMGVWKTNEIEFEKQSLTPKKILEYKEMLPDFTGSELIGSPYAVDTYQINPLLGSEQDVLTVKKKLNERGMLLILDFVPNHFGRSSKHIHSSPEIFISKKREPGSEEMGLFFKSESNPEILFAHGRDPYFGHWIDTVQIDYRKRDAREFMLDQLVSISKLCDGLRCDMAMMIIRDVFQEIWEDKAPLIEGYQWPDEFWPAAIEQIKSENRNFQFIAECYWGKEPALQSMGFDYTYSKEFTDHIKNSNIAGLKSNYSGRNQYQYNLVRFLENHDEQRILSLLHPAKNFAASILLATSPGMRLYYDGQWEGNRYHTSIHLGRMAVEEPCKCSIKLYLNSIDLNAESAVGIHRDVVCPCCYVHYDRLLFITKGAEFKYGDWTLLPTMPYSEDSEGYQKILAFGWIFKENCRIVIVNYSPFKSLVKIDTGKVLHKVTHGFINMLTDEPWPDTTESQEEGFIRLKLFGFQSVILKPGEDK